MTAPVARVRAQPRWKVQPPPDAAAVHQLAESLRLPEAIARLLAARGFADPEAAKAYLRPRLEHLHPSASMRGMDRAVARLLRAIQEREKVMIHGDYDVDGICSTTLLVRTLQHLGGEVKPFIPHRLTDGYDLGPAGVRAAQEYGAKVVVTCDCGTSAHAAVAALQEHGIDVIITDHHLPSAPPPECLAVLNPRIPGCEYPDKDLCAAGVAFKLACALLEASGTNTNVALRMLDLVALATIADVAPLRGENRVLARYGLRLIGETSHTGLRALLMSSGLDSKAMTAGRIGYILAPRLNAAGRLGHALRGVELMLSEDPAHANAIARELEELNRARQEMDRRTLDQARGLMDIPENEQRVGVVLSSPDWHPGVIGIVASRLVEEFHRPFVLVAVEDGVGKGSGRSIPAFDLHGGLTACRDTLLRYGGHRVAAGVTVEATRIEEFAQCFDAVARAQLTPADLTPELRIDAEVPIDAADEELERLLRHLEPFGVGNPSPVFGSHGVRVATPPRVVGENGLKVRLQNARGTLEGIWWGGAERAAEFPAGSTVSVAYRLERDEYQGQSRLCARIADMRVV